MSYPIYAFRNGTMAEAAYVLTTNAGLAYPEIEWLRPMIEPW